MYAEYPMTDRDFELLRTLVSQHTGIQLSVDKRELVYSRLARRLRALGLQNFAEYCALLQQGDSHELEEFTNAVTTNLTSFFRENHHFEYLAKTVIPECRKQNRAVRIWSAGCSSGEEPYSLAIVLAEAGLTPRQGQIIAGDLDSQILGRAQQGVYRDEQVKGVSTERLKRFFLRGRGSQEGLVRVRPQLQQFITFVRLNLMENWQWDQPFEVIFCRNVVIYFGAEQRKKLVERFAQYHRDGGYLFIGHSESLFQVTDRYKLIGKTIYRKESP